MLREGWAGDQLYSQRCSDAQIQREKGEVPESFPAVSRGHSTRRQVNRTRRNQTLYGASPHHIRLKAAHRSVGFIDLAKRQVFQRNNEVDPISSLGWPCLDSSPVFHQREWTRLQLQRAPQLRKGRVQEWISRKGLLLRRPRKVFWPGRFFHPGSMVVPQCLPDQS